MKVTKFTVYLLTDDNGHMVLKSQVKDPESSFGSFEMDDDAAQSLWRSYKDYEIACYEKELMEKDD